MFWRFSLERVAQEWRAILERITPVTKLFLNTIGRTLGMCIKEFFIKNDSIVFFITTKKDSA